MMQGAVHLFDRLPQVDTIAGPSTRRPVAPVRAEPLIGLIRNPRSHRNENSTGSTEVESGVIVAMPHKRSELRDVLADFADRRVDYIAIDGGDGTVRDVLTCGAGAFGESWPDLILLPSGKTNALAHDLGIPDKWTLSDAIAASRNERRVVRRPLVVAQRDDEAAQVRGFVLGAGAYTAAIGLGQDAHRIGAFNAAVVGVTAIWSALQAFLGGAGNPWRRGTRMRLADERGEIEHSGGAPLDERYFMFASTLQRFPAGLDPFRDTGGSLRLALFDNSDRRLLMRLPLIFRGRISEATRRRGFHVHGLERLEFDIDDSFILDGEAFPPGSYLVSPGPRLRFVVS